MFTGWKLRAEYRAEVVKKGLRRVGEDATGEFRRGLLNGPHTGRIYRRAGGKKHQASINRAQREYPASDTGALLKSLSYRLGAMSVRIGTEMPYSKWLRTGTRRMARRRMSDHALRAARSPEHFKGWARWKKKR